MEFRQETGPQQHAIARGSDRANSGRVISVNGSQAGVQFPVPDTPEHAAEERATVGRFLRIETGLGILVGVITNIAAPTIGSGADRATAQLDLLGEIKAEADGRGSFQRGVTQYPTIGDRADLVSAVELRLIFHRESGRTITVGSLQQDDTVEARVLVDEMLHKHFAVFGTTGVGKSSGVAVILREVLAARPDLRVFLIDPHNEYGHSFEGAAQVLNPRNLRLPFWLFNFEETVDVFFRGRPGVEEEVEILSELIPLSKAMFAANRGGTERASLRRFDAKSTGFTIDTPVPYQLTDLIGLLNERMGKLENRSIWSKYHKLLSRIESVRGDPRYAFMFDNANVGGDTMVDVLGQLFRLPANGRPMTIMQLAGFPAEVVDSVVSVVCRMAFEFGLWSDGAVPLLFVCEEAHRYAPADRTIGFGPTRKAVSRIAKEGRKYGVYLSLITQRPAELDATIISQCSTLFAMRMANDRDQAIVRSAVSDAAASLLSFVPSLGTREVFAFGEGVALPTRLHFKALERQFIPHSESATLGRVVATNGIDKEFIASVVERWRGAMMTQKARNEDDGDDYESLAADEFSAVQQTSGIDRHRLQTMLKPDPAPPQHAAPPTAPAASPFDAAARTVTQAFHADLQDLRRRLKNRGAP